MLIKEYQSEAYTYAVYPREFKILYPMIGLAGELGELLNVYARNGNVIDPLKYREMYPDEIGDVVWYVAALATDMDMSFEGSFDSYVPISAGLTLERSLIDLTVTIGLLANSVKKIYRDEEFNRARIKAQIIITIESLSFFANALGLSLDNVAAENLRKLRDRRARGVLHGSGDKR